MILMSVCSATQHSVCDRAKESGAEGSRRVSPKGKQTQRIYAIGCSARLQCKKETQETWKKMNKMLRPKHATQRRGMVHFGQRVIGLQCRDRDAPGLRVSFDRIREEAMHPS